jgi:DNA-binding transcriptional LysR family regulator
MSGLTIRHVRAFLAVAEVSHFGRAATRLDIAQPLLSQMILRLEQVVGTQLLIRRPAVRLTPAGEMFLPYARRMLEELQSGVEVANKTGAGELGHLHLGFPTLLSLSWLPQAIADYQRTYPAVQMSYLDLTTAGQLQGLRSGQIDAGFIRQESSGGGDLCVVPIDREPLLLAVSPLHRLATQKRIEARDLAAEPFILFPRNTAPPLFDHILEQSRLAGVQLNIEREGRDWLAVVGLIRAEAGISFVPASLGTLGLTGLVTRDVADLRMSTTLSLAYLKDTQNPVVRGFVEAVLASPGANSKLAQDAAS